MRFRLPKSWGLDPSSFTCVRAIQVLFSISHSTWNRKAQNFKTLGWSEEIIWSSFKRYSMCFTLSEEKVRRRMDFYVNTMKLKPEVIAAQPNLLSYSVNTRIRPRYCYKGFGMPEDWSCLSARCFSQVVRDGRAGVGSWVELELVVGKGQGNGVGY
ncbi:hypothetical protein LguiA_029854 [Lonicera macranthoides]